MNEQKLQNKIIKDLEAKGYYVNKIITSNHAGCPDLIACTPTGKFLAIEVKTIQGRASKLQETHMKRIQTNEGQAFICYGWEDYERKLKQVKL